jgi:histidine triad (HIT) family protein
MSNKTVFARIIDREIPAKIVFEDDQVLAFHDAAPRAPVHVLIIPKKPIDMVENLSPDDERLVGHMVYVASQLAKELGLDHGYRLVMNNGTDGGQTVFHLHLHLLGGRALGWPPG